LNTKTTASVPWRLQLTGPVASFAAALMFAALVAVGLRLMWNPGLRSYVEYVPIAGVFAAFLWDRLLPSPSGNARHTICDVAVLALALMRVFVPPLPFVSGHTLFASYSALTARRWPLRVVSLIVLAQVVYVKLFVTPGWPSMVGGLGAAAALAAIREGSQHPDRVDDQRRPNR
jgi:hypothetical protein